MEKIKNTDCSFSDVWASPKNWKTITTKSALKKNWYVQCVFYDPIFSEKYPKGFPFRKKLNKFHSLEDRKAAVQFYLEEIPKIFRDKGYNPITKKFMFDVTEPEQVEKDISPNTAFIDALNFAWSSMKIESTTNSDMKSVVKYTSKAIKELRYDQLPIVQVRRKHIRFIIERLEKTEGTFSAHKFNKYRGYLQMLFSELEEIEAIENNIITGIRKRKQEKRIREVLSDNERILVKNHLSQNHKAFWTFTELFFHTGGRITEMLRLKVKDVNLDQQYYMTLVKKGKMNTWIKRPIKDIALPIWRKHLFGALNDNYVFSKGLTPGAEKIRREQINRRWKTHVKDKLGITSDFYALRHLNLDEVSSFLNIEDAAFIAGHTSTSMVSKVYAVGEKERQIERVKKISNKFA